MTTKRTRYLITVGLFFIVVGGIILICSGSYFSYTIEKLEQIQKSETIMNYSFLIHQSQDKLVKVQMIIGQTLDILATSNENFTFLVANYTNPENATTLDEPDITYYIMNGTTVVNKTWGPQSRTGENGTYYLAFLARDFPAYSPVDVYANVTKKWKDIEVKTVVAPDLKALIDSNYAFIGLGSMILGGVLFICALQLSHKIRSKRHIRSQARFNRF